jgi:hypothetical protein
MNSYRSITYNGIGNSKLPKEEFSEEVFHLFCGCIVARILSQHQASRWARNPSRIAPYVSRIICNLAHGLSSLELTPILRLPHSRVRFYPLRDNWMITKRYNLESEAHLAIRITVARAKPTWAIRWLMVIQDQEPVPEAAFRSISGMSITWIPLAISTFMSARDQHLATPIQTINTTMFLNFLCLLTRSRTLIIQPLQTTCINRGMPVQQQW